MLVTGETYHVMSKSIAGYKIFSRNRDYTRMRSLLRFFKLANPPAKFSYFVAHDPYVKTDGLESRITELAEDDDAPVQIIAFCIMPTHIHLVLKQLQNNGIANYAGNVLNSYAKYFNTKYERKGTLWMSRFKNVRVETDEQLLHLTRYVHLNPATADIVKKPEGWPHSSYQEYISPEKIKYPLTEFSDLIDIKPKEYQSFVKNHAGYQKELALIKKQILE